MFEVSGRMIGKRQKSQLQTWQTKDYKIRIELDKGGFFDNRFVLHIEDDKGDKGDKVDVNI